jgi:hypothetical protein
MDAHPRLFQLDAPRRLRSTSPAARRIGIAIALKLVHVLLRDRFAVRSAPLTPRLPAVLRARLLATRVEFELRLRYAFERVGRLELLGRDEAFAEAARELCEILDNCIERVVLLAPGLDGASGWHTARGHMSPIGSSRRRRERAQARE